MDRDEFTKRSIEKHGIDMNKTLLIDKLEFISSYFAMLRTQLLSTVFTVQQVWFGGRTQKDAIFHHFKNEIQFERMEDSIIVRFNNVDYDVLLIDNANLKSEKFDSELSEELLNKYLMLFDI